MHVRTLTTQQWAHIHTYAYTPNHNHTHTHSAQHSVKLSLQFDTSSLVSSLVLVRDVLSPQQKTNMAGSNESINQTRHLPIVMFHLQLIYIECFRKFPILQGQHFQSASSGTLLIDELSVRWIAVKTAAFYDWWSSTVTALMGLWVGHRVKFVLVTSSFSPHPFCCSRWLDLDNWFL